MSIFRTNYSLEQIAELQCTFCDKCMRHDAFGRWCRTSCRECYLHWHFVKDIAGYRLTDIVWEDPKQRQERRFWSGSENNIFFRNNFPSIEFEIESFDKETLLRLDAYISKRLQLLENKRDARHTQLKWAIGDEGKRTGVR